MSEARAQEPNDASSRQYRRGALLGMTMAEAFILIAFALLLLLAAWKAKTDEELDRYRQIEGMTPEQVWLVAEMIDGGRLEKANTIAQSETFDAIAALVESGADPVRLADIVTDGERWRFIDKDELLRILEGAKELPEDLQRDLADMVEIEDIRRIVEILQMTDRAPENQRMRDSLAGIGAQISAARAAEAELVSDMRETLGPLISQVGGVIDDTGAIILSDTILFDQGSPYLSKGMTKFLDALCVPWMKVMMRSPVAIAGAQIEGHASSEWGEGVTLQEAFLKNLDLSQQRAATVLRQCLALASSKDADDEVEKWARTYLRSVGFSSSKPVVDSNGVEIPEQSRRVVFSLDLNQERLIDDLEEEVGAVKP